MDTMSQSDSLICTQSYNGFVATSVPSCIMLSTAAAVMCWHMEAKSENLCMESCCTCNQLACSLSDVVNAEWRISTSNFKSRLISV